MWQDLHSPVFHIYRRVSLAHDCPAKDYISQVPLQLGMPMWLSSGQWNMNGNNVGNFQFMPLIKESREHTSLSLSMMLWLKPEQPSWTMRWRTQDKRILNSQPCEAAILNSNHFWILYMWEGEYFPPCLNYATFGTSLVLQWLRLCSPNAGGLSSIPGQGSKILHAATKSCINTCKN